MQCFFAFKLIDIKSSLGNNKPEDKESKTAEEENEDEVEDENNEDNEDDDDGEDHCLI